MQQIQETPGATSISDVITTFQQSHFTRGKPPDKSNTISKTSEQLLNAAWVYCAQLTRATGNTSDQRSISMSIKNKIVAAALSGLAIAGIVAGATLSFPQLTSAQTSTPTAPATTTAPAWRGGPLDDIKGGGTYLAQALGITETDLQAAQTKARAAEIQQAVTDGLITQAQADAMLNGTAGQRGVRVDLRGANLDHEKFLAEALGITTEKLQAAEESAAKAELAQAVIDGRMTQAQADQITAEQALQKYIADKGLFKSAVDSAVQAGVITQAQADTILTQAKPGGFGFGGLERGGGRGGFDGGPGGPGGHGGHGGRGGPDQTQSGAAQPNTQS
jgi:hypothetical protein